MAGGGIRNGEVLQTEKRSEEQEEEGTRKKTRFTNGNIITKTQK